MKLSRQKIKAILLTIIFSVFSNFAYATLIFDEDSFYSLYENPTENIDFTHLKDGTTYSNALNASIPSNTSPYLHDTTSTSEFRFGVWEDGWSDNFLFRGKTNGGFNLITRWNGNSIISDFSPITNYKLSILALNDVTPLALTISSDTYTGFLGIVPNSISDTQYVISFNNLVLHDFKSGFSNISTVPLPSAVILMLSGLLGLFGRRIFQKGISFGTNFIKS